MILHDIWTVASKELRACFTDKIILMQMIILPFAIVFGYGMLMGVMADANISDDGTCNACVINAPDFMEDAFKKLVIINGAAAIIGIARGRIEAMTASVFNNGKIVIPFVNVVDYYKGLTEE